jgi:hypothetical protein
MNNRQIKELLAVGYSPDHIAEYGQCSIKQVNRVLGELEPCIYCGSPVNGDRLICSDKCQSEHFGMSE